MEPINTNTTIPAWMQSSTDATAVSKRVEGIVIGASSFIILIGAQFFHITLQAADITSLATSAGMVVGAIQFLRGLILWAIIKLHG